MSKEIVKPKRRQDGDAWSDLGSTDIPDKTQVQAGIDTAVTANNVKTLYESNNDTNAFTDAEQSKLAAIEAGATADQTGAEIKSAYEAEADTNAFTDAEKTKLSGIEPSADVTDQTNVDAAGAVMNSDSTTASMSFVIDEDSMVSDLATKVPTQQSVKAYVDAAITLEKSYKGGYDAATNSPDLDTTPIANIKKGDVYDVTVAGTFFTEVVEIGDTLRAKQDDPTILDHWVRIQANLTAVSIKSQYESNADTNAFTDAEKTKLGNITSTGSGSIIATSERNNLSTAYSHSQTAHAPSDAQKNSDITKGEIEAKLTGAITSHTHALPVANQDYYIATTGSDTTGDGTVGNPWATPQKALSHIRDYRIDPALHCTIHLAAGTYDLTSQIVFDHPDGQLLKLVGAGVGTTFVRSNQSTIMTIKASCSVEFLYNFTIDQATYSGSQTVLYLEKYATLIAAQSFNVDKMYRCVNSAHGARAYFISCTFSAYAYCIQAGNLGSEYDFNSCVFDGAGGAATPQAFEINRALARVAANCTIQNNNIGLYAGYAGTILDDGATMSGNTTDHSPALSTANTVTYGNFFGKILSI